MRQYVIPTLIATVVASAVSLWATSQFKLGDSRVVMRTVKERSPQVQARAWPSLLQIQVDAMSVALKDTNAAKMTKKPVIIYCSGADCEDLAFDFENALETAHWKVDKLVPVLDSMPAGLVCSDPVFSQLITTVTGLQVTPMTGWHDDKSIALLIGKRDVNVLRMN